MGIDGVHKVSYTIGEFVDKSNVMNTCDNTS
jgi:hypothetical protein